MVLEAVLPVAQVRGPADVAAVQVQPRPLDVHVPPGRVAVHAGSSAIDTPCSGKFTSFRTGFFSVFFYYI